MSILVSYIGIPWVPVPAPVSDRIAPGDGHVVEYPVVLVVHQHPLLQQAQPLQALGIAHAVALLTQHLHTHRVRHVTTRTKDSVAETKLFVTKSVKINYKVCLVANRMIRLTGQPFKVESGRENNICYTGFRLMLLEDSFSLSLTRPVPARLKCLFFFI